MTASLVRLDYQGTPVTFNEDGWFNATVAAAHYSKRPVDWLALDSTKEYLAALMRHTGISEKSSLIRARRNSGTWFHPKLAVSFARWLDVDFAIWCDVQIDGLLKGRHPHLDWRRARSQATASFKVMNDVLQMVRQESGKATASYHYINEARLINGVLTGQFSALDRERLSEADLSLLANLEVRNSVLIGRGLPYEWFEPSAELTRGLENGCDVQGYFAGYSETSHFAAHRRNELGGDSPRGCRDGFR